MLSSLRAGPAYLFGFGFALAVTLGAAACSVDGVIFKAAPPLVEDCATPGDEDGNGLADCADALCTPLEACAPDPSSCTDQQKNGSETDVDCGGSCAACGPGKACVADRDCAAFAACDVQRCRAAASCAEILQRYPTAADGAYTIAPATVAFSAVCDMTRDGGGWTLLLKADGDAVLPFTAAAWTDATLLNETDLTVLPGNAKYPSFLSLPVGILRGDLDGFRFSLPIAPAAPARAIFSGAPVLVTPYPTFNTGGANWSAQPNCQTFGINLPYTGTARFGWSANQEDNCLSNDTAIGLGINGRGAGYLCASSLCSAGIVDAPGNGLLWGR